MNMYTVGIAVLAIVLMKLTLFVYRRFARKKAEFWMQKELAYGHGHFYWLYRKRSKYWIHKSGLSEDDVCQLYQKIKESKKQFKTKL